MTFPLPTSPVLEYRWPASLLSKFKGTRAASIARKVHKKRSRLPGETQDQRDEVIRHIVMKRPLKLFCILLLTIVGIHSAYASDDVTPLDIVFKRQAVGRLTFDEGSAIPLSGFKPNQVVNLKTEYPQIPITRESCRYTIDDSLLHVTSEKDAESALWMGGFNPFVTFDVSFAESQKQSGKAGVEFATADNQNRISVIACFDSGQCCSLRWSVMVKGKQLEEKSTNLKKPVRGPFTLRVQLLGSGLNVFIVRDGRNEVVSTHDF